MIRIDTVLLKVASRCNISCDYCYMYRMGDQGWSRVPKLMSPQTVEATATSLSRLLSDQQKPFAVVLHGGEPLLLGEGRLKATLRSLRAALNDQCPISIQTNGVLISDRVLDVCAEEKTSLSVSLDGPKHVHDLHRIGHNRESTHEATIDGIARLRSHAEAAFLFSGVLSVIDPTTDPDEVYAYLKASGAPSMDFLYRDGNHTKLPSGKKSFESQEYGRWLARVCDLYFADQSPVPIRILDDTTRLVLGGRGSKEGVGSEEYGIIVVDTDGTIAKNDTLKSSYDRADRFDANWSVYGGRLLELTTTQEFRDYHRLQVPTSAVCRNCSLLGICGGGMPLTRWSDENQYDNPSVFCNDHKFLIDHIRKRVSKVVG